MKPAGQRSGTRLAAAFVAVAIAAVWARVLLLGETFVLRDYLKGWVPESVFVAQAFARGRLPEWSDALDLGVSVPGNPNFQLAYPPGWLRAVLPGAVACDLLVVLHLASAAAATAVLAGRFGARFAGACLAGGALALSGCVVSTMSFASVPAGVSWMAWAAVAADGLAGAKTARDRGRWAFGLAVALALVDLAGEPSLMIGSAILAVLLVLARSARPVSTAAMGALAVVVGACLALVALLPAALSIADSGRRGGLDLATATTWSMHPLRLLELVWPRLLGDRDDDRASLAAVLAQAGSPADGIGPSWATGHLGAAVVVLAVAGGWRVHRGRAVLGVALLFVLLALGRFTPVYALYRALVWPEHLVRYPHKHLPEALVLLCALAGAGHRSVFAGHARRACLLACAGIAALLVAGYVLELGPPAPALVAAAQRVSASIDAGAALAWSRSGALLGLGGLVGFAACLALAARRRARWLGGAGAALALVPSLVDAWALQPTAPRAALHAPPDVLAPAIESEPAAHGLRPRLYRIIGLPRSAIAPDPRVTALALHDSAHPNVATEQGLAYVPSYESTHSGAFQAFWSFASERADGQRVLAALDVRWMLWPDAAGALPPSLRARARTDGAGGFTLAEVTATRPRAFATTRARWVPTVDDAFAASIAPGRDMREAILVGAPELAAADGLTALTAGRCDASSDRPEHVVLECSLPAAGHAVLLDAWAPGWQAWVDGAPAGIERMDGVARAVAMPAGRHRIEMRFRAPGLRTGAALSLVAALACALAAWRLDRRARRSV